MGAPSRHFLSLLTNRKVGARVGIGFGCMLVIVAILAGIGHVAFRRAADGFSTYAERVKIVDLARDLDASSLSFQRLVRDFTLTSRESDIEAAKTESTTLRALVARGLDQVNDPQLRGKVEEIGRLFDGYVKDFEQVVELKRTQNKTIHDQFEPTAATLVEYFESIVALGVAKENSDLQTLGSEGLKHLMLSRLNAAWALGRHDAVAAKAVNTAFSDLSNALQGLDGATRGTDYRKNFDTLQGLVTKYRDAYGQAWKLEGDIEGIVSGHMKKTGQDVAGAAKAIKDSGVAAEAALERETVSAMERTNTLNFALSGGGIVLGIALAWVIGQGISRPVVRLSTAMRALADGEQSVVIPGLGRRDEIGDMSKALQVFRDHMMAAEEMRREQERTKQQADADKKAALSGTADHFERSVKAVVDAVAAAADEMRTSAQAMSGTAEATTTRTAAVAGAAEQATSNVQTVAAATEELSASIAEIGRQVAQSSRIAQQAVDEAQRTNKTVDGLSRTAQRIGDVVKLIQDIASQTNLLALNATIEAARAGEAGKGFAVVASEVKALANQTAKATEEIAAQIGDIQGATADTVHAIQSIGNTIGEINDIAGTIAAAIQQQGAATQQISGNVQEAARGTTEIATNIAGVSQVASETGTAAIHVLDAATGLSHHAQKLSGEVQTFIASLRTA